MKAQRLQAAFARKREIEHIRFEKSAKLNQYFDHWDKQNTRYKSWTTPEYYEQADENLRKMKEKKMKENQLEERRVKLRQLVRKEKEIYENELESLRRPKPRKRIETDILLQIDKNLKNDEEDRRRLELEAKLYGRWRHGVEDESKLFESKSDNEVLAKLNWMDKQIEEKMAREEREREMERINLQKQEEARLRRDYLLERQKEGEKAIKEIQELEEYHIAELKRREEENDALKQEERWYRDFVDKLEDEIASVTRKRSDIVDCMTNIPNSTKRMKMLIRDRSNINRQDLKNDIDMLRRIEPFCKFESSVQNLMKNLNEEYEKENIDHSEIESMYESEAKANLIRCQQAWARAARVRNDKIFNCLTRQRNLANSYLTDNLEKQRDLIDIREAHYSAVDTCNEKLKILLKEQESCSEEAISTTKLNLETTPVASPANTPRQLASHRSRSDEPHPERDSVGKIIKDFSDFYNRNDSENPDEKNANASDSRLSVVDSYRDDNIQQLSRSTQKLSIGNVSGRESVDMKNEISKANLNANLIANANRKTFEDNDDNLESSRSAMSMSAAGLAYKNNDCNMKNVSTNTSKIMNVGSVNNDDNLRQRGRGVSRMTLDESYLNDNDNMKNANVNESHMGFGGSQNGNDEIKSARGSLTKMDYNDRNYNGSGDMRNTNSHHSRKSLSGFHDAEGDNISTRRSFSRMGYGETNLNNDDNLTNVNQSRMTIGSSNNAYNDNKSAQRSLSRIGYGETNGNDDFPAKNLNYDPSKTTMGDSINNDGDNKSTCRSVNQRTFDSTNRIGSGLMRNTNKNESQMAFGKAPYDDDDVKSTARSVSQMNFNRRNESNITGLGSRAYASQNHSPRSEAGSVVSGCESTFTQASAPKFGRKRVAWN